ncbi:MAG TPA: hypothetical protein VFY04_06820 [Solirubrobacterales bacterium]|nr:hypothetical protein [Solirubrobacterales bacterium]
MREGTRTALLVEGRVHEDLVKRAIAAAEEVPPEDRVRTGLEAVVAHAETDPAATRSALSELRTDHAALDELEACLGGGKETTLALGAAIQVALCELDSPEPDLRARLPELRRWLEADW